MPIFYSISNSCAIFSFLKRKKKPLGRPDGVGVGGGGRISYKPEGRGRVPRRVARQTEPGKLAGWSVTEIGYSGQTAEA